MEPADALSLLEWKRRVFRLYDAVRLEEDPEAGWDLWRHTRDEMFRHHAQSPLPPDARHRFEGLDLFDYAPELRIMATIEAAEPHRYEIATSGGGTFGFTRFALAAFTLQESPQSLELYWLDGYGGGLFLPFRDGTSGRTTYGAGRYLFDTVKGADLGMADGRLVLDLNFAYNPSCAYDPRWVCPLAPPANRLEIPIAAGEKTWR